VKKIANIITEKELANHKKLDWINYSNTIDSVDLSLPTLVVGWSFYKMKFPHLHPDILNKTINRSYPKVCWEFSMDEKITDHFTGIENFVKQAPRMYSELFQYISIDPLKNKIQDPEHLFRVINVLMGSYYQYKEEIIYVHSKLEGKIIGVYLNAFKYFGFDTKKIITIFNEKFTSKTIDSDGLIYQSYYKQFPDFDQLKRSMVLFLN
jgi:hypothetical protein